MRSKKIVIQLKARVYIGRCAPLLYFIMLAVFMCPRSIASVDNESKPVRVGYYENEVFQEGAQPGAIKTGYAYEYYQKLSEYTGWRYEYVYGDFSALYQSSWTARLIFSPAWHGKRDANRSSAILIRPWAMKPIA